MPSSLLRADHVAIRYDGATAATPTDATLAVEPGEVVLLLGPSGCGKSTLALAANGLVPQSVPAAVSGGIVVGDAIDPATTPTPRVAARVGMVFQDPDVGLIAGTLLDEVCFGPENQRLPVDEVLARGEDALRRTGLWDRRHENPDTLSGGGRQRLAIACALALGAPLLVLDEPTANLDPVGTEEVYATLRDLVADGDHGVLLVEHDLDACVALVDRVVVLDRDGRTALTGTAREILAGRAGELMELGVWLPVATLAAWHLREAGMPFDELPLTPAELTAALDAGLDAVPGLRPPARTEPTAAPSAGSAPLRPPSTAPSSDTASLPGSWRTDVVVEVEHLTVNRSGVTVLDDVSLTAGRGDFVAVVGTNGAGKTTLLRAIAGVAPPPRRTVTVAGLDPARANVRELARRVGFVFQNPEHQFVRYTVAEELAHALEVQRVPAERIAERVEEMLTRFGLAEHRDRHPFLLSGGQKRRLSVGTALIAGAEVLALDEPTFGQDRERAAELLDILAGLNAGGTTVLVVTHDLQLVAEHASHVAVLRDGRLVAHDRTERVLASDALLAAGLRLPPLAEATRGLTRHPEWRGVTRVSDLAAVRT
ncbi:ABC transporter ATP-binding protein [Myceligenerans pegani]|uniref:Energy-coupling factor ABC transporter ATP-binding protein n=1 Tax=Myceligenerans pegani TaxID=2776917 RepID=A0ABR9N3P0_9MICO|nr:ABC transporter ATP-binding protein [Myceligenerans sp. TRM 65318]MBE1878280.1 energy-coupling factor ABC transporter ATP-binding protein [Myceligenerans sp. TRM 65318]MBE3020551.1 energy-coupling factor ABC transporter ATP-binding protein [Myceligenerans sp. TRM 65318]